MTVEPKIKNKSKIKLWWSILDKKSLRRLPHRNLWFHRHSYRRRKAVDTSSYMCQLTARMPCTCCVTTCTLPFSLLNSKLKSENQKITDTKRERETEKFELVRENGEPTPADECESRSRWGRRSHTYRSPRKYTKDWEAGSRSKGSKSQRIHAPRTRPGFLLLSNVSEGVLSFNYKDFLKFKLIVLLFFFTCKLSFRVLVLDFQQFQFHSIAFL